MVGKAWKSLLDMFTSDMTELQVKSIHEILKKAMDQVFGINGSVGNGITELYGIFASVAIVLLLVYFSMDLFDKLSSENFTIDTLVLNFAKLIMGVALINNGIVIIQGLYGLSEMVCSAVIDTTKLAMQSTPAQAPTIESIWDLIAYGAKSILYPENSGSSFLEQIIIGGVSSLCVNIIAYQRAVNLAIRTIISPIIFADVIGHGLTNKTMHYIRVLFAICMEGPIICISIVFLNTAMIINPIGLLFSSLAVLFVTIKVMFGAAKTAKDIIV